MHVLQLALHGTAAKAFIGPCDDRPISEDGGKGAIGGLDLLHVVQLVFHGTAVTTIVRMAPSDDRPMSQDGGKTLTATTHASCAYLALYLHPECCQKN